MRNRKQRERERRARKKNGTHSIALPRTHSPFKPFFPWAGPGHRDLHAPLDQVARRHTNSGHDKGIGPVTGHKRQCPVDLAMMARHTGKPRG
jgi:hypothetical protein